MESCSIILLCLILFIMMSSSFICIATYYKISFLLKANIPLGVHTTFSQSIHRWWAFTLLLRLGCCKQCRSEDGRAEVSSRSWVQHWCLRSSGKFWRRSSTDSRIIPYINHRRLILNCRKEVRTLCKNPSRRAQVSCLPPHQFYSTSKHILSTSYLKDIVLVAQDKTKMPSRTSHANTGAW